MVSVQRVRPPDIRFRKGNLNGPENSEGPIRVTAIRELDLHWLPPASQLLSFEVSALTKDLCSPTVTVTPQTQFVPSSVNSSIPGPHQLQGLPALNGRKVLLWVGFFRSWKCLQHRAVDFAAGR
eukprot:2399241-Rhodomonas_salina.2